MFTLKLVEFSETTQTNVKLSEPHQLNVPHYGKGWFSFDGATLTFPPASCLCAKLG